MDRPKTIRELVYEEIKNHILSGYYRPGQRLIETNLAEELNVSRTPIRDALNRLEAEGLITSSPTRGLTVTKLSKDDIKDLYQARAVLEGLAAKLAALMATEEELRDFSNFIQKMELIYRKNKDAKNVKEIVTSNNQFHRIICQMSKNKVVFKMLADLENPITLVRSTSWVNDERKHETFLEHRSIAEAILGRDPEKAQKIAEQHIYNAWKSAEKALDKEGHLDRDLEKEPDKEKKGEEKTG